MKKIIKNLSTTACKGVEKTVDVLGKIPNSKLEFMLKVYKEVTKKKY